MKDIQDIYDRFNQEAEELGKRCSYIAENGTRLLCGPPRPCRPIMISLNPGAGEADLQQIWPKSWPMYTGYERKISKFSKIFCSICDDAGVAPDAFNSTYSLMFRSDSWGEWEQNVDETTREQARDISTRYLSEIVEALNPPFIYVCGFGAIKLVPSTSVEETVSGRRKSGNPFALLKYGSCLGRRMLATPHLSGSRMTKENHQTIAHALRNEFQHAPGLAAELNLCPTAGH